jgi:competence protein ComGC
MSEFSKYPLDVQESILKYIEQLDEKQRIAYAIAKDHLGTSFNILKSIGYINWKKEQDKTVKS